MTDNPTKVLDPDPISIELQCLRAEQPIGDLFIASIPHDKIVKITHFDVRRVLQEQRDVERYLGIQRPLNMSRASQLHDYVNYEDASFPTAIIIAVEEPYTSFDPVTGTLTLSNVARGDNEPSINISNIARVIDGQHRIAGLKEFKGTNFDVPVTIFVGADIADQAHIFATVNLEQAKVNKSLTYDLYSLAKSRSPQKTCHNVVVVLDSDEKSPFYHRIKRLGVSTDIEGRDFEPISQATFVESLIKYISKDAKSDRDIILRDKKPERASDKEIWIRPFRNMFIDEKDVQIVEVIYDYFSAIRDRWPVAWNSAEKGNMLNRTNGVRAFMRAFRHIHQLHNTPTGKVPRHFFDAFLKKVDLEDKDFNTEKFQPGSSGESALVKILTSIEDV